MEEQLTTKKNTPTTQSVITEKGEKKFKNFLESISDVIIIVDNMGIIQLANTQIEKVFGYKPEEIIGKQVEMLIPEHLMEIHHKHRANYSVHPKTREMGNGLELVAVRKDKTEFPVEISLSPFKTEDEGLLVIADIRDITYRKTIENAIKKSQVYNRALIETSLDPLFTISPEGKIMEVNEAAIKVTGIERKKLYGTDFSIYFTEPEKAKEIYYQALKLGFVKNFPLTIKHINGNLKDVLYNASVYKDDDGNVLSVFAAARDITEWKRAEELLLQSEEKYRTLFESSSDAIQLLDEKGFFDCNGATLKIFGFSDKKDFIKMHPAQVSPPYQSDGMDSLTAANNKIAEAFRNGTNHFEWMHRRQNGEDFFADVLLTKFNYKGKQVLQATVRDISSRKKTETELQQKSEELKKSSERFFKIFYNSPIGMVITKLETNKFLYVNNVFTTSLGYTKEDVEGKTTLELNLFQTEIPELIRSILEQQGEVKDLEILVRKKNGETFWSLTSIEIILFNSEKFGLTSFIDITNRKKAEAELKQKSEELAFANKELNSFSYSVAHDLKAPLRAINGFSMILKKNYGKQLEENANKLIDTVIENSTKLSKLIDDLLEFSKNREKEMLTTEINMNLIVKEVYDELSLNEKDRIIDFKINPLPATKGDSAMIKQVWVNLIANAYKFTHTREKAEITIGSQTNDKETIYFIKDNGAGFDMKYTDKLFQVFQRLHSTEEFEGNGIGLALAKRIIERHKGRVWAEGKVNEGATFYFSLPV